LAALGTGVGVGAFAGIVKSAINVADELGKLKQKSGVAVEGLSALRYQADLSDVSFDSVAQRSRS